MASVDSSFLSQDVKTTTQAARQEREEEQRIKQAEEESRRAGKGKGRRSSLRKNSGNPVVVGNALLVTLLGAGLGVGAYQKHIRGELSWKLVGICSGVVGAVGAVDYFVSKYVFPLLMVSRGWIYADLVLDGSSRTNTLPNKMRAWILWKLCPSFVFCLVVSHIPSQLFDR